MSSQMKLSLLALVSTAAAIPHAGHSRFHKPSGYQVGTGTGRPAYPTGGWYGSNSTGIYQPTGTGVYSEEPTTTIDITSTLTTTLVSTIYASPSPVEGGDVGEADVSSKASGQCGPETIYVTATDKVTVTVTPSEYAASSPSSPAAVSSSSSSSSAPAGGYEIYTPPAVSSTSTSEVAPAPSTSEVAPAPSSAYEKVSVSLPNKPLAPTTTAAPVVSTTEKAAETSTPAPSSTAPATGSGGYTGGKRGLAYNDASLCSSFSGAAAWAYNWASSASGSLPDGVMYVPLAWKKNEDAKTWLGLVADAVKAGSKAVMGFNEPDQPEQSGMTPSAACSAWKDYMNPIASNHPGVTIMGPSVTNGGGSEMTQSGWGLDWLKQFKEQCPDAIYHATNIHFYDIWSEETLDRFKAQVEAAYKLTGKPVWVTEFGLTSGSPEQIAAWLKDAMDYMEGNENVHGYAYFMVGTGANQLNAGTGLSTIGEVYAKAS